MPAEIGRGRRDCCSALKKEKIHKINNEFLGSFPFRSQRKGEKKSEYSGLWRRCSGVCLFQNATCDALLSHAPPAQSHAVKTSAAFPLTAVANITAAEAPTATACSFLSSPCYLVRVDSVALGSKNNGWQVTFSSPHIPTPPRTAAAKIMLIKSTVASIIGPGAPAKKKSKPGLKRRSQESEGKGSSFEDILY